MGRFQRLQSSYGEGHLCFWERTLLLGILLVRVGRSLDMVWYAVVLWV